MFAALIISGVITFSYVGMQQLLRQGANDPQIEMAEDISAYLSKGAPVETLGAQNNVDITKSLAPFFIAYDEAGKSLASSATLDGKTPTPPLGVFDAAKTKGENRVTWQPAPDVRIAAVIIPFHASSSGFVLAGRSLREIEKRETTLFYQALATWCAAMVLLLAACALSMWGKKRGVTSQN